MVRPNLTQDELYLILGALCAVSPSGGGSAQYSLFHKLCQGRDIDLDRVEGLTTRFVHQVTLEYLEHIKIT